MWLIVFVVLGCIMIVLFMFGVMFKGDDKLMVKVEGGGLIGVIVVDVNVKGEVRVYVFNL